MEKAGNPSIGKATDPTSPPLCVAYQPCLSMLDKLARAAFRALALLAFSEIADFAVFEQGLHFYFAAAGAKKALG